MKTETVKVKTDNQDGYKIINKDDFNTNEHELFDPKPAKVLGKKAVVKKKSAVKK